jgi:hypothetical protein
MRDPVITETTFTVRAASAMELLDLGAFVVVLAEHPDGSGLRLEIQRALEFDEQDRALGMDTYCLCTDSGATHYGGIVRHELSSPWLTIVLDVSAAEALGTRGYRLRLAVDPAGFSEILAGIQRATSDVR